MAGGGGMGEVIIFITHPYPLLLFDCHSPPWYKFVSLPSLPLLLKLKMVAIIFTEKSKEYNGLHMFTNDIRKKNQEQVFVGLWLPCEYYNLELSEVINMQILPLISTHYPAIKG